jgi:phosphatidylserine/phosphatidylglycerophosphate/cardiolipin synthase-like enzyme
VVIINEDIQKKIFQIIEKAKEFCYIVTPYFKPSAKVEMSLRDKASNKIKVVLLVRANPSNLHISEADLKIFTDEETKRNKIAEIKALNEKENKARIEEIKKWNQAYNFQIYFIENLHAKLYANEKEALITSENLMDWSRNTFEIGYVINDAEEITHIVNDIISNELLDSSWNKKELALLPKPADGLKTDDGGGAKTGYCIMCGTSIERKPARPFCFACYKEWKRGGANYNAQYNYCHICGKSAKDTDRVISYSNVRCKDCELPNRRSETG